MAHLRCETCGNDYDKPFQITKDDKSHVFDSFECAIHMLAPICQHCDCRIIGHGIQVGDDFYCCAHCARKAGEDGAVDHVPG